MIDFQSREMLEDELRRERLETLPVATLVRNEPTREMLDVWNRCMEDMETLAVTWPRLLAVAKIDL